MKTTLIVKENMWDNTYFALKVLINNCYYAQVAYPMNEINDKGYYKEYCTVRLQTARQSGHSYALCKIAYQYFNKALILSPTEDMSQRLRGIFPNATKTILPPSKLEDGVELLWKGGGKGTRRNIIRIDNKEEYYFDTFHSLNRFRGMEYDAIFIDCAFALSKKEEDIIYDSLGPCMNNFKEKFFIFVE